MNNEIEDIKARIDIVDLIREYLPLKAVGMNFQSNCPFHNEKTPSFVVSPDKQIWHCFGCNRGGDIFTFLMEKEGYSFPEALEFLANKAGVELRRVDPAKRSRRSRLLEIMSFSARYFAHVLETETGKEAKEYLLRRGLSEETIKQWRLGYSPNSWDSLVNFLQQRPKQGKKFSLEEIKATGMIIPSSSRPNSYYDRFRGRIMFPITDVNNNVLAFTARILEASEKEAKYINSPQTELYDKSKVLFALDFAKQAIRKQDYALIVEGQMDAIACHNHGIANVVATSGTALTSNQLQLLSRYSKNIVLAFDMDTAGQAAADRGIKEILSQGMNVKVVTLPDGKDPDDIIQTEPQLLEQAIADKEEMLEYYYNKISQGLDLTILSNKVKVKEAMFAMIVLLANKSEQGYWLRDLAEKLNFVETDIREDFIEFSQQSKRSYSPSTEPEADTKVKPVHILSREERLSDLALALLIKKPSLYNYAKDRFEYETLATEINLQFYQALVLYLSKQTQFDYNQFKESLGANELLTKKLAQLSLLGDKEYYNQADEELKSEFIKISLELKKYALKEKIKELEKELTSLEQAGSNEKDKLNQVMQELKLATEALKKIN